MAATAYASLVSLLNTLDQIHNHRLVSTFFDTNQTKSLSEKINVFVDFVEKYSDANSREVEDLVRQIADAAHEAENIVEVHAADRVRGVKSPSFLPDRVRGGESPSFLPDLQTIIDKMESIKETLILVRVETRKNPKEEIINVKEETGKSLSFLPDRPPSPSPSAPPATDESTAMVGFDDYKRKLFDELLGHDVHRSIISISGMGGIGKTTLARNLFENSHIKRHFNVHVWIAVSQDSSARKVCMQALSYLGKHSIDMATTDNNQLSLELHQTLFNRRYLVVLDDIWSVDIWDKIKFYFPENKNRSRIVLTTRESKLGDCIGSSAVVGLNFLDEEFSWKLFCEKTFPQQGFPPELEEIGKKIVKKCGGLPLGITVIGGLLGKSPRMQEDWEKVAKDKSLILNTGENKLSSILHLSYKYLPAYLRPCFLYLGLYPQENRIDGHRLIKFWVAEGFIKANRGQCLEDVGESYLNNLIDRNLLLHCPTFSPSMKCCSIHDLVRDFCIDIGHKENFFCVQRSIDEKYHFIVDQTIGRFYPQETQASETPSILRPLIVPKDRAAPIKTKLLRVFCCDEDNTYSPFQEVNMRFLHDYSYKDRDYLLPSLVSQFWSLQTLIISGFGKVVAPAEIWKMPQLRHIDIRNLYLPDPPPQSDDDVCVLENLQTLNRVSNLIFTEEVCKRIPNIKELGISYEFSSQSEACPCYHLHNISCFNRLESLIYYCHAPLPAGDSLKNIKFPSSLKDLTLWNSELEWSYMAVISSLPHLQSLSANNAIAATEWIFIHEKFVSLKYLHICFHDNLTKWIAQSSNFPVLENLYIVLSPKLDEIPSGIGEIPTLQSIYMFGCSESASISAARILDEKESFGNLDLQVRMQVYEPELIREKIQQLGFTCQNLEIWELGSKLLPRALSLVAGLSDVQNNKLDSLREASAKIEQCLAELQMELASMSWQNGKLKSVATLRR